MKIGIVGTGFVGSTAAYALINQGIGREIVLVDANTARASAEADDLLHSVPFTHPIEVRAGEYDDLKDCRVVIIAAGTNQRPGETRLQLLDRNVAIFKTIIPPILKQAPDAILLVATNPVDVMTHFTASIAGTHGLQSSRVLGTGTTLDTARFRALLGKHLGVDSQHIHAYVLGEHGDSEVLTWSLAGVGGIPLEDFCRQRNCGLDEAKRKEIDQSVRRAAYSIIQGKGATYYGIGTAIARIVDAILSDQRSILTVCTPLKEIFGVAGTTISLPHLVGGNGILASFPPSLNGPEEGALRKSAQVIVDVIKTIKSN